MKYSRETFTRQISWLRALKLEIRQRLSSTLSYMGPEMRRSGVSLEELQKMERRLKEKFLANTPALGRLRERVGVASGRGYVLGLG